MKLPSLIAIPLIVVSSTALAQSGLSPSVGKKVENMLPNQIAFLNLPEQTRNEFVQQFREANRMFAQKRIFECLEVADKAQDIFPESPEVYNLKGSCYVEIRAFDKALAAFTKAGELSTNSDSVLFNVGEVYFVTKEWQKAMDVFEKLLKRMPEGISSLSRLAEYKILLCKLKLGLDDEAAILANKYDYFDDSPYYYFANAAIAYDQKDLVEAERWLARAMRVFRDRNILAPWHDTLVEYGYIKSFYGGEENEVEAP